VNPAAWHAVSSRAEEAAPLGQQFALDMPAPNAVAYYPSIDEPNDLELFFPSLWEGSEESHLFPFIYRAVRTARASPPWSVSSISEYKIHISRNATTDGGGPGWLTVTIDRLATFNFGDYLRLSTVAYEAYAYTLDGAFGAIPTPSSLARRDSLGAPQRNRRAGSVFLYRAIPKASSNGGRFTADAWLTPLDTAQPGGEITQLCPASGRLICVGSHQEVTVHHFLC
jgi:hypothetical protein